MAIAVVAGAVVLLLTILIKDLPLWATVIIVACTAGLAFLVARRSSVGQAPEKAEDSRPANKIGTHLRTDGSATLEGITTTDRRSVELGNDIDAKKDIQIKDINVNGTED
ncbi:hypothetical protein [Sinomonas atrocyanea]|uniref:hypothetical protein n=1 Tax=Sinomonas atrocyanea TaxID=37927 RepID=UPI002854282B|nr:hypothetical protein [Sinomonas atrocyanea]MDR6620356.1 threonine/homoserine/homoserine lactone efflux protein [Sinomonas atrocyanea]